jgi:uncharacterized phage infection (PIP) family protein YhgE
MAKISRRHVVHATNACILSAALALPTGLALTAAESQPLGGGHAQEAARTTEPPPSPPSPPVTPPGGETTTPEDTGPDGRPTDPGTSPPSAPDETTDESEPADPGDTGGQTPEPPPEQEKDIDEATATLKDEMQRVPAELASTVDTLIGIVGTVEDPRALPQDRQGVIESAKNLSTALAAIVDPNTPPELRKQLVSIVKQVTSTLETVSSPRVPAEERSTLILVIKRSTSPLDMICDSKTPGDLRDQMIAIMKDTAYVAQRSHDSQAGSGDEDESAPDASKAPVQVITRTLMAQGSSSDLVQDRRTPAKEREELADITRQVSALLKKINDPETSSKERSEAMEELDEKASRMKDLQERAATAQQRPEESLGKAAAFCTSAIFEAAPESALIRGLKDQVPAQWQHEGVKDFWKAREKSNDSLDVLAQLKNNEQAHGAFEIVPIITELAELVPHDRLFGDLSGSAMSCEQTAKYLEEKFGVTVGNWLT